MLNKRKAFTEFRKGVCFKTLKQEQKALYMYFGDFRLFSRTPSPFQTLEISGEAASRNI